MTNKEQPIRCLEFFSGIGGLHYSLNIAEINAKVVQAFDVNSIANKVYENNFSHKPSNKTIDRLRAEEIDSYKANCWLLSPPCQPYTNGGKRKDQEDPRSKPLLHLIDLLPKLKHIPDYVFLENVKNFEVSQSRERLVNQLDSLGYSIKECLLSPTQFGIPNHRLRYYLMAKRDSAYDENYKYIDNCKIETQWPFTGEKLEYQTPPLSEFLETSEQVVKDTLVPDRFILRLYKFRLDIVRPVDIVTSCITKAYGSHHIQTSGSLVQTKQLENTNYDWDDTPSLLSFGLRFLSPTEIARLHSFPVLEYQSIRDKPPSNKSIPRTFYPPSCLPHLNFPEDVTQIQQYRLLGNSLNCWVVAELYRCVLFV